jgi:uncharacterized repeat protein (TIGR03803 family)
MPDGSWKEIILHSFGSTGDGAFPSLGALAMDSAGNLYGTASGVIYRLTHEPGGNWKETILYRFQGADSPGAGVVLDPQGNLYGTTIAGGNSGCACGVVYKLSQCGDGTWMYTVLHTFTGLDGAEPDANLILDGKGNLYGTTPVGGAYGAGVVFEVTP